MRQIVMPHRSVGAEGLMMSVGVAKLKKQHQRAHGVAGNLSPFHKHISKLMSVFQEMLTFLHDIGDRRLEMRGLVDLSQLIVRQLPKGIRSANLHSVKQQTGMENRTVVLKVLSRLVLTVRHSAKGELMLYLVEEEWMLTDGDPHSLDLLQEGKPIAGLVGHLPAIPTPPQGALATFLQVPEVVGQIRVIREASKEEAMVVVTVTTGDMEGAHVTAGTVDILTASLVVLVEMLVDIRIGGMLKLGMGGQWRGHMSPLQGDLMTIHVQIDGTLLDSRTGGMVMVVMVCL